MDFKDIIKEPPPRAFLEQHVDAGRLPEFLSKRSPVFKDHPIPSSKKAAIDLMLEQPNTIRRPVLVVGPRALFGFDKDEYREALK